jgi:hypothetical protein
MMIKPKKKPEYLRMFIIIKYRFKQNYAFILLYELEKPTNYFTHYFCWYHYFDKNWFKLFSIGCKMLLFTHFFVFFELRSDAMQLKKSFN